MFENASVWLEKRKFQIFVALTLGFFALGIPFPRTLLIRTYLYVYFAVVTVITLNAMHRHYQRSSRR